MGMSLVQGAQESGLSARVSSFASESPLLAAAVVAAAILVLLGAGLLIRWFRRTPGERFRHVLAEAEAVTVLMHPNPDPDAMAAALGTAHVAESAGTEATLRYSGQIRHQENRAFRTVLGVEAEAIESAEDLGGEVVLVDHNEPRGFRGSEAITPYAVVDHHPGGGSGREHTDIRPEYGACATIIAEYAEELGLEPGALAAEENGDAESALPAPIATGLLYGILADTSHLTRGCSPAEFDASAYLYHGVDEDDLDRIANPPVDAEVLDTKARAITARRLRAPFAVADVGSVSNLDAIPQAADELLGLEGVSAVVVYGDKDETLHLSGRSRDDRVHMGEALEAVVADIPMADAGGHARMGGGQLSIPHMEGLREESGIARDELEERIFGALSGEV